MLDLFIERPQLMAVYLSYLLFLWFLFFLAFGDAKHKKQSAIMALVWGLYCCCFYFKLFDKLSYIETIKLIMLIDIITCLVLVTDYFISRYSGKLALIIAFAVLCHSMLLLNKSMDLLYLKYPVNWFCYYYDELLLTVGLTQLLVSYDKGFYSGIKRFADFFRVHGIRNLWGFSSCIYFAESLLKRKERENQK